MKLHVLMVILTTCAGTPEDLSGKVFIFPQETNTAHVKLVTSSENFKALTVCLRSFTDLSRHHALFSLSTLTAGNGFLIFKSAAAGQIQQFVKDSQVNFERQDYKLNAWHTVCSTWDSGSGLGRLWLDAWPSSPKFSTAGAPINGSAIITLGQEQDSFGGRFDAQQSFVGMLSDVHVWNYVLSPCEIQRYTNELNFTPGNIINWRAMEYQTKGRVLLENKEADCIH